MRPQEAAAQAFAQMLADKIQQDYPTGIGWLAVYGDEVVVDWVDTSSDRITVGVEHTDAEVTDRSRLKIARLMADGPLTDE